VFGGEAPTDALLRLLARALGMDASDLFVLAGRTVSDDLEPRHERIDGRLATVVWLAIARPGLLEVLTSFAASLPERPGGRPPSPKRYHRYPASISG
jgi:hypothetical protein